jgi:hypothetical protein
VEKKENRYPTHCAYEVRSYAKFERKTEPVSRSAEEEDLYFRVHAEEKHFFGGLIIAGGCENN